MTLKASGTFAVLAATLFSARAYAVPAVDFDQGVNVTPVAQDVREDASAVPAVPAPESAAAPAAPVASPGGTYSEPEVLRAIEELGGNISGSVADIIAAVFKEKGRPTGVIVGREAQGAFVVGYRQGSGKVLFKSAGAARRIAWRAPSIGFQVGASANEVTILVYNTRDYDRLLQTFAAIKGSYHYVVGGGITYLHEGLDPSREDAVSLAHVAVGVGLDAGVAIEGLTFKSR